MKVAKKFKLKGSETADLQRGKTTDWSVRRAGESSQVKVVSACYRENRARAAQTIITIVPLTQLNWVRDARKEGKFEVKIASWLGRQREKER